MAQDPYKYFRIEARELLDHLGKDVLELERGGDPTTLVPRLLRWAHTLKGAARVVKQPEIAEASHAVEDVLAPLRESGSGATREVVDRVLVLLDRIGARLAVLSGPPEPEASRQAAPEPVARTVRTEVAEMDALLDGVTETHSQLVALRRLTGTAEQARHLADLLVEQLGAWARDARPGEASGGKARGTGEALRGAIAGLEQGLVTAVDQIDRELGQVRDAVEQLRMVPASLVFGVLERTVRDAAQSLGKSATFEGLGGGVRLDAHVADGIQPALVQVVKNAVSHGVEARDTRSGAGKPPEARVVVEVKRQGQEVVFRCSDDGRGIDVEAVRRAALQRGLPVSEVEGLETEALLDVLLGGGITTAETVTAHSGRGVGLDVLREALERLGGRARVRSERGRGTTFEIAVPLSLASVDALLVESRGVVVAIPLDCVRRTLRVDASSVARTAQGDAIVHEGTVVPVVALSSLLGLGAGPAPSAVSAVLVEVDGRATALTIDALLGTRRVVMRSLPELAPSIAAIAGATLDAEGNPRLVLDPSGLVDAAQKRTGVAPASPPSRLPVLVIDDSLTTRMLEQSILESAGYEVDVATSAEEGLERARRKRYGLFLVDVEMPGMDGFTFVERTRADAALGRTPAILITSRGSAEDRERGREAGAEAYIVKSEFDQAELLAHIRRLVA